MALRSQSREKCVNRVLTGGVSNQYVVTFRLKYVLLTSPPEPQVASMKCHELSHSTMFQAWLV